ncbi:hypothetical protein WA026_018381 [Henosepilachna vigintioctopunctata]|uniref:Transmembrane protein n=1 Tax=Henosepilachna vigintioctopunctata TaxID=420089 RepID=A0AAW1V3E0_9CUCU
MHGFRRFSFLVRVKTAARSGSDAALLGFFFRVFLPLAFEIPIPSARQQHTRSLLRHTRPGKPYTGRRRKRSRFFKSFPSLLQVPPSGTDTPATPDKPLDPRQTHLLEELFAGFGPGVVFFHLSPPRTFLYPPPEDPPSRRPEA